MADVFTREKRSLIMARVKGRNTQPELLVRSILHRLGYRFRLHFRDLPGCPDVALPRHRKVVFVHGCFWHGHEGCPRSARPTTNRVFWEKKLSGNMDRDKKNLAALEEMGWKALVVWTCETKNVERLTDTLSRFMAE
jgi:DNA mismatch endonuclease, patch repair protein